MIKGRLFVKTKAIFVDGERKERGKKKVK